MKMPALRRMAAGLAVGLLPLLSAQAGPEKGHPSWLVYTILYTDKSEGKAVWQPLPGYEKMPGTGRTETIKLKTDPAVPRRYNLHIEPQGGGKSAAPAPRR